MTVFGSECPLQGKGLCSSEPTPGPGRWQVPSKHMWWGLEEGVDGGMLGGGRQRIW